MCTSLGEKALYRLVIFFSGHSYSLGALSVGELNSPRVAPLPTPDSRLPTPHSLKPVSSYV
ncbi:hypothetical protein BJP36_42735 [Moorena producens JHB]|uniref:Uncharacterized protein n=1 Tax=Moorena producens (strain JHB) TaxID=1454205 RepID=A0A9Q9UVR3_MOOP1|nr:hypothetical protein [Moorena producens]WAN69076.1 hypothetical protein BJP36_42735 [Moorena producens JHB]